MATRTGVSVGVGVSVGEGVGVATALSMALTGGDVGTRAGSAAHPTINEMTPRGMVEFLNFNTDCMGTSSLQMARVRL